MRSQSAIVFPSLVHSLAFSSNFSVFPEKLHSAVARIEAARLEAAKELGNDAVRGDADMKAPASAKL